MPEATTYRLVTPKDSQALEKLIAATADSGGIGFTDDYQADLLAVHRGLAEEFHGAVAEQDGEVVGMVFGEVRWVQYAGQVVPGVYISHLRVHPDHRRQGIAQRTLRLGIGIHYRPASVRRGALRSDHGGKRQPETGRSI